MVFFIFISFPQWRISKYLSFVPTSSQTLQPQDEPITLDTHLLIQHLVAQNQHVLSPPVPRDPAQGGWGVSDHGQPQPGWGDLAISAICQRVRIRKLIIKISKMNAFWCVCAS